MTNMFDSLDDSNHVFVIAEAGSNWKASTYDASLVLAKKLIQVAADCGADAIKFQTFKSDTIYAPNAGKSDYLKNIGINSDINELFEDLSMPYDMLPELTLTCKKNNIEFMSTPFSIEDAKQIDPFVNVHKISSFESNHVKLLEFLAKTSKPILLSTGVSTLSDVEFSYNLLKKYSKSKIILLQCTSKYPCHPKDLNLSVIPMLKNHFHTDIGLSDHSLDPIIAPIMSIALGAKVIEKHFTLDKNSMGPDHAFSLNPEEFRSMVNSIRSSEISFGNGIKSVLEVENELYQFAKRALQATTKISKGEKLIFGKNFDILRPGNNRKGLEPKFLSEINNKLSLDDLEAGEGILHYE